MYDITVETELLVTVDWLMPLKQTQHTAQMFHSSRRAGVIRRQCVRKVLCPTAELGEADWVGVAVGAEVSSFLYSLVGRTCSSGYPRLPCSHVPFEMSVAVLCDQVSAIHDQVTGSTSVLVKACLTICAAHVVPGHKHLPTSCPTMSYGPPVHQCSTGWHDDTSAPEHS